MADLEHFEKPLNRHNSVRRIAMKFGNPFKPNDEQKFDLKTRWPTANARTCPRSIYSKRLSSEQNRYGADAVGVHIGATWRI